MVRKYGRVGKSTTTCVYVFIVRLIVKESGVGHSDKWPLKGRFYLLKENFWLELMMKISGSLHLRDNNKN